MRKIKFRGKVKYNGNNLFSGDWAFGSLVVNFHEGVTSYFIATNGMGQIYATSYEVVSETIGQFTSKVDKKAREIFGGDICRLNGCGCVNQIEVIEDKGDFFAPVFSSQSISSLMEIDIAFEIIGNIHDNPELLK